MIAYERFVLDNGLTVLVHKDETTPLVAFNLLYKVGARNENPDKTGFAHLFEHLMFEGSKNIPHYDAPLQQAGGENNAFTNNNITNFYITVPKENLETAFWLESDRMLELSFSQQKLEVQKKVVIEEFKQRYLNQPYGDWNLLLRPMTYKVHPYQWPTIGKEISHIENATLEEVKEFFFGFYAPNNAILSVAGNITKKEVETLAEKWFGPIPRRNILKKKIPQEPKQTEARKEIVQRPVPVNAIYQAFHMCGRNHDDYYATDLISDILSNGKSSRMNQKLVKEQKFFSSISAYITGDVDPGLFIVNGNLNPGVTFEQAETAIRQELDHLMHGKVEENELAKVKNKVEANLVYSEINILNKAMNLAYFEHLGDASIINQETQKYQQVTPVDIQRVARNIFQNSNCSTLNYQVQPS
ncbi:MAG TPA: peptidase M16 [Marinilabiliales bacterium]|nr:MAG: peptidase M16 [Bacteroidetes bacterium GWD2_40_43]OFX92411.1 MAG: peptidase M16 [Bacteroidetes bacterium GWE2_40_63]OFY23013.1 MAG: peptidase M16 [Bacteroidetes bacterium GWF2_40_13]OFZ29897.1 MAG: peptidase M16 [Bacteroidetes bacterium RIFOXYC2_FULL_40_12]HAM99227.1 peptidase M16 [Marinilabiliales bacterium]